MVSQSHEPKFQLQETIYCAHTHSSSCPETRNPPPHPATYEFCDLGWVPPLWESQWRCHGLLDSLHELPISQAGGGAGPLSFSLIHLFATLGDILGNCQYSQSHRFHWPWAWDNLAPFPGGRCSSHSALVSFPVGVSAGTAVFSALAWCSYLGQAYFNSAGTDAGLRPLSRVDTGKYWVGSAQLGC